MKQILLTTLTLGIVTFSFGQSAFKKNDIYLEALGNGLFGSLNYERQLTKAPGLGARVGIGFYSEKKEVYVTLPVGINYLFPLKSNRSFIDAGLGLTWTQNDGELFSDNKNSDNNSFINFTPSIGYRRHTLNNVMWRVSLTPVINKYTFVPWLGISIGKRF